jgi:hypothetical protein
MYAKFDVTLQVVKSLGLNNIPGKYLNLNLNSKFNPRYTVENHKNNATTL